MLTLLLSAVLSLFGPPANVSTSCDHVTLVAPYGSLGYVLLGTAVVESDAAVDFIGEVTQPQGPGAGVYSFQQGSGIAIYGPCTVHGFFWDRVVGNDYWSFTWAGPADFNCDGDVDTDADIEDFFTCIATACSSSDFDGDGDSATDADIIRFFSVLSGSPCP